MSRLPLTLFNSQRRICIFVGRRTSGIKTCAIGSTGVERPEESRGCGRY